MSSHRRGRDSDHRRPNVPRPSGPRPMEPNSTNPRSNESRSNDPLPNGPRPKELRPTGPTNVDPQPTDSRLSGPRTMGPRSNDPQLTGGQPQPGASGAGGQNQIEITSLSKRLAEIRLQIETIYPLKAEQKAKVQSQKKRIAQMERDKRSAKSLHQADEELRKRGATLRGTERELETARLEEEEVFMSRWRLQHDK
ncbi:piccolo [Fusarium agapanthi]|uniref:Piccolo n=1 Tax=Fusarium agapanthi TaxID=1803897 RepID=A0A9P5EHC2_9HYPO|nr:piccolo [Fusarium agapanthi]